MTEKEAIELFEKAHTVQEQWKLENDIQDIRTILSQNPINMYRVGEKIKKINEEHPENITINHIIFPQQIQSVPYGCILNSVLLEDLNWKQIYLQAKKEEKLLNELCKEMRKSTS